MKRRILLLMMTALLSVGAWAKCLWTSETEDGTEVDNYGFSIHPTGLTAGDIISFTINTATGEWGNVLTLKTVGVGTSGEWTYDVPGDTDLASFPVSAGTVVSIVVTDAIVTAAENKGLWIGGYTFKVTSIDHEKATGVNLYTNAEGNAVNYWSTNLSSSILKYAKTGDVLHVTISAVGNNENWRKLYLQDAEGNPNAEDNSYTGNILYTCENGNLKVGTIDIRLTDAMVSKAQEGNLHIGGFEYTFTAVDLYHAPIELANDAVNTTTISDWENIPTHITLADRTLTKDGNWNTLCLPFALTSSQIAASPLAGATIKELNASSSSLASDGTLTLAFTDASSIEAGKPYIVKWEETSGSVENPLFEGVTITATTPTAVEFSNAGGDDCKFVGQFSPFTIDAGNIDKIIMLGSGSKLGYSQNARTLKTFRAHFFIPGATAARAFVMNFGDEETTGIISVQGSGSMVDGSDAWYSLGGQRLQGAPTVKGVYIQNGRKVVVK